MTIDMHSGPDRCEKTKTIICWNDDILTIQVY